MSDQEVRSKHVLPCGHELLNPTQVHYCSYLGLEYLLTLQRPFARTQQERDILHPDEHQFVVVHQMCELAFAQILFDLRRTIQHVRDGKYPAAHHVMMRITIWTNLIRPIMATLRTMQPEDFKDFREDLAPASGAESILFRKIELTSGVTVDTPYTDRDVQYTYRSWMDRPPGPGQNDPKTRWWVEELNEIAQNPSLASSFDHACEREGVTLHDLYDSHKGMHEEEHPLYPLRNLADALHRYDEAFVAIRSAHESERSTDNVHPRMGHVEIAKAQIGEKPGTGHTTGVPYLRSVAITVRFFPELWAIKKERAPDPSAPAWSAER